MKNDKELLEILLMPIDVVKGKNNIKTVDGRIQSTQKYRGCDPDVSDVAVEFYRILYGRKIVDGSEILANKQFCGDTMMSFKSLRRMHGLQNVEDLTHCLANFWILPMDVGHSSSWTARRGLMHLSKSAKCGDDMGLFLKYYSEHYDQYCDSYNEYANEFELECFTSKHMLKEVDYSQLDRGESGMLDILKKRAQNILVDTEKKKEIIEMIKSWS